MADDVQANIGLNIDTSNALAGLKALQSELSAIHTQLSKLGPAQRASAAVAQRALVDNINATGKFAASMTTVRTTAESFTHALEKNKLTMGEYFRYAGGASKSFGKAFTREFATIEKVAIERVKTLQTQYIKLGRDANGAMKAIQVRPLVLDMNNLQTKTAIAAQKQQILNQLLKQGSTQMLNWGKNTQWAGRQLMVGFSIPIGIFASKAMQAFSDMEKQIISFKRVYGDLSTSAKDTDAMAESIKNLALEFTKYGVAVADTMDMASKAAAMGKTGADLLGQVQQANKLAVLGQVDQQQALQTTITLSNAFGTATQDLGKKINFLNAVENQTVLSIEDLTTAIPKAGPVVKQLGGDVEDLAFFLTAMKEGGINASEGANALKSGLASIINPTNKARQMLQGFGINLDSIVKKNKGDVRGTVTEFAKALDKLDPLNRAKAIEQLFGKFQFARISTLMKNVASDSSQAATTAQLAQKSSVELAAMSARELRKISSSPLFKFQKAIEDFQAQLAPIGEQFMKFVTPIIDWVNGMLKAFNNLGDGTKQFIVGFTSVVAGLGPILLMTFGLIANGFANIIKGFAALKSIFNKTQTASEILGQETSYMTEEQMKAKAVAASLDQVHGKLVQTFNVEAGAVNNLAAAYERAKVAGASLLPGAMPGKAKGATKTKKFATGGIIQGPGTETSDSIIARVSKNEAIIPAKNVKKYPGIVSALIDGNIPGFSRGSKKKSRSMADKDSIIRLFQSKSRSAPSVGGRLSFAGQMQGMIWDMFEEENAASAEAAYQYLISSGVDPVKAKKIVEQKYTGRDLAHTNPKYKDTTLGGKKFKEKLWTAAPGDTTPDLRAFNQFFADRIEKTKGKKYATGSYIGDILQDEERIAHISEQSGLRRADVIKELKKFEAGQYPKPGDEKALRALRGFAAGESGAGAAATVAAADVRLKNFGKAGSHSVAAKAGKFNFDPKAEELATKQSEDMRKRYQQTIDDLDSSTKAKAVQTRKQANSDNEITKAKESQAKSAKEVAKQNLQEARAARTNGDKLTRAQKKILAEYDAQREAINAKTRATRAANKKAAMQSGYVVSGVDQYIVDSNGKPVEKTKKQKTPGRFSKFRTAASGRLGSIFSMSQAAQAARGAAGAKFAGGITGGRLFGAGMAVSIGGNLIGGMVGGETGSKISGAGDVVGGVLSVASLFGNKLGPVLGKIIPLFSKFLPVIGWVVTGFQLLSFAIDKATEKERKRSQAIANNAEASGVQKSTMDALTGFFGTTSITGSYFSTPILNGSSSALGPVVDELRQNEGFKTAFKNEKWGESLKAGTPEGNKSLLESLAIRFGADLPEEAVKSIIAAIQAEAGVSDIKLDFKSIDVGTKEGRAGIVKNVTSSFDALKSETKTSYEDAREQIASAQKELAAAELKQSRVENDPNANSEDRLSAAETVGDLRMKISLYGDLVDAGEQNANVLNLAKDTANKYQNALFGLNAAYQTGKITEDEYKESTEDLRLAFEDLASKNIPRAEDAVNAMIDANTGLSTDQKNTLKTIKNVTDRYNAYTASIAHNSEAVEIAGRMTDLQGRMAKASGRGLELLRKQYGKLADELLALSKIPALKIEDPVVSGNEDPYGIGKDTLSAKQQARQKKWQDAMSLINLEEEKINKKYEDRIAALDKVNELNQAIAASQKDQLDLADALSRGDIAAAARAAQTMRANDSQREYEKQKRALEQAQQNELDALTVLVNGKYYTKDQIQGKLNYYEKTSLNNAIANNTVDVATGGMVKHYEPGGGVRGPGTGTSDDIPAMLSNGEYVIRAKAASALGLDTLNKLNHAEKFAKGGKVAPRNARMADRAERVFKKPVYDYSIPTNIKTTADMSPDTSEYSDPRKWLVARPGGTINSATGKIDFGFTGIGQGGPYRFRSAQDAYLYYSVLLKNRQTLSSEIDKVAENARKDAWRPESEIASIWMNNQVANRTYGPYNGLNQVEAKSFAKAIRRLYGNDKLKEIWQQFNLSEDLLSDKPIKLDKTHVKLEKKQFEDRIIPTLSNNAPAMSPTFGKAARKATGGFARMYADGGLAERLRAFRNNEHAGGKPKLFGVLGRIKSSSNEGKISVAEQKREYESYRGVINTLISSNMLGKYTAFPKHVVADNSAATDHLGAYLEESGQIVTEKSGIFNKNKSRYLGFSHLAAHELGHYIGTGFGSAKEEKLNDAYKKDLLKYKIKPDLKNKNTLLRYMRSGGGDHFYNTDFMNDDFKKVNPSTWNDINDYSARLLPSRIKRDNFSRSSGTSVGNLGLGGGSEEFRADLMSGVLMRLANKQWTPSDLRRNVNRMKQFGSVWKGWKRSSLGHASVETADVLISMGYARPLEMLDKLGIKYPTSWKKRFGTVPGNVSSAPSLYRGLGKIPEDFSTGGFARKYADGDRVGPMSADAVEKATMAEYIKRPLSLHNITQDMSRKRMDNLISRNKLTIPAGTDIVRVANFKDMQNFANLKPGQSVILDQFHSVTTGSSTDFIDSMRSGKLDTGGRSSMISEYPLIKYTIKSNVPGILDMNKLLDEPASNVVDGLLARGQVMKLKKITTSKSGTPTYHVELGGKSRAILGLNELGFIYERVPAYKELLSLLGHDGSKIFSPKETANDIISNRNYESMPNVPKVSPNILKSVLRIFGRIGGPEAMFLSDALFGTHNLPIPGPKKMVSYFPSGAFASGGMASKIKPSYFNAGGLARGTDTIPAMLTPGEFVMTRSAVQNFGVDNLKAINAGVSTPSTSNSDSVYNYSINVNVSTNSDASDIARAVMTQIKRIDSQRVRGVYNG